MNKIETTIDEKIYDLIQAGYYMTTVYKIEQIILEEIEKTKPYASYAKPELKIIETRSIDDIRKLLRRKLEEGEEA